MGNCVATCEIPDTNVPEIADLDITERQKKILELVEKNRSVNKPWTIVNTLWKGGRFLLTQVRERRENAKHNQQSEATENSLLKKFHLRFQIVTLKVIWNGCHKLWLPNMSSQIATTYNVPMRFGRNGQRKNRNGIPDNQHRNRVPRGTIDER